MASMSLFPALVADERPKAAPVGCIEESRCPLFAAQMAAMQPVDDLERLRRRRDEIAGELCEAIWNHRGRGIDARSGIFGEMARRHGFGLGRRDLFPRLVEQAYIAHRVAGFGFKNSGQARLAWSAATTRAIVALITKTLEG